MSDLQITENFWLSELLVSDTAARLGIDNSPSEVHKANLIESTKNLFQPIRDLLCYPVIVSSGYRSERLNAKIPGSSKTSAHTHGFAIDFRAPGFGDPYKIATYLAEELPKRGIKFDQIIYEFGQWVHIGYKNRAGLQRGQVLSAKKVNGKTAYYNGIIK